MLYTVRNTTVDNPELKTDFQCRERRPKYAEDHFDSLLQAWNNINMDELKNLVESMLRC